MLVGSVSPPAGHRVRLAGGEHVRIRPITPGDSTELARAYQRLSPESRRLRFLSPPHSLSQEVLTYLTCVDGVNHAALVAVADDEPGHPGVGVARYVRLAEGADTAEVAVTVLDDHEHRGIGTLLMEMLLEKALRNGVRRVRGYVAAGNRILDLARAFDASITPDSPGVVVVDLALPRSPYQIRRAVRAAASSAGVGGPALTPHAEVLLRERYLQRDDAGTPVESPRQMMERVARAVAAAEDEHRRGSSPEWEERFCEALCRLDVLPSSPVLMNAGTGLGFLSACVVLPVDDTLSSIFTAVHDMALVHQSGGGTGFSFSHLRPRGDVVRTTHGVASGPVSFMRVFDVGTDVVRQGGRRRGANMAVLSVSHPDVEEFVRAKWADGAFENFNLSVAVDDAFMHAVSSGARHALVNPRTGATVREVDARCLFALVADSAHRCGEPGMLFLDRIARDNPLPALGAIEAVNPCGEVPLLPGESCTLGSVNLAHMVTDGAVDWERLRVAVRLLTRLLDDVVTVNRYPLPALETAALGARKIGAGVMGLAEVLLLLGIPYASNTAVALGGRIAAVLAEEAAQESQRLAEERGAFPLWRESALCAKGAAPRRNAQLTSIAPTGSISMIAGTTAGIEPIFAVAYARNVLERRFVETNPLLLRALEARGLPAEDILAGALARGSVHGDARVPADLQRLFATALEIAPEWHLRMQHVFQRHVDAAVSKTVNLSADASPTDVERIFQRAWRRGAKGITVYRYGSRAGQVLRMLDESRTADRPAGVEADLDYAGGCAGAICEAQ